MAAIILVCHMCLDNGDRSPAACGGPWVNVSWQIYTYIEDTGYEVIKIALDKENVRETAYANPVVGVHGANVFHPLAAIYV